MRILLCGGAKTANIESAVQPKFDASGDSFQVVKYINDIYKEVFLRGDYFDRAVIFEQGITQDFKERDEYELRSKVSDFANHMAQVGNKTMSYVFVTWNEDMANIISEEILSIFNQSAILLRPEKSPITVAFMIKAITTDVTKFPEEMIYHPPLDLEVDDGDEDDGLSLDKVDVTSDVNYTPKYADENTDPLFGDSVGDLDSEEEVPQEEVPQENEYYSTDDAGYTDSNDYETSDYDESQDYQDVGTYQDDGTYQNDEEYQDTPSYDDGSVTTDDDYQMDEIPAENEDEIPVDNEGDDMRDSKIDYNDALDEGKLHMGSGSNTNFNSNNNFADDYDDYGSNNYGSNDQNMYDSSDDMYGSGDYNNSQQESDYDRSNEEDYQNEMSGANNSFDSIMPSDDDYATQDNSDYEDEPAQQPQQPEPQKKRGLFGRKKEAPQPREATRQPDNGGMQNQNVRGSINVDAVRKALKPFAARGNSIVVTGCGGCGTSLMAYNLANMVHQLGYTVLLVDFDTVNKAQSYMSRQAYDSIDPDGANLKSAVNSSTGIMSSVCIVASGFHLLTMGMGSDTFKPDDPSGLQRGHLSRFVNMAKSNHNFVIYDIPFEYATGCLQEVVFMADNIVMTIDCSAWGITKTLIQMSNIESEDFQDTIFNRGQLVFNRCRNLSRVFGKKIRTANDIVKAMDGKIEELLGEEPEYFFSEMHIAGTVNEDPDFENGWFESAQYSDTKKGQKVFGDLIMSIVSRT